MEWEWNKEARTSQGCVSVPQCAASGSVHICDQNCKQKIPHGPNEDICYVSRRIFEKRRENQPSRKRGACQADCDWGASKAALQRTLHQPKFVSAFSFARSGAIAAVDPVNFDIL
ncbi:hypothetical protein HOP50_06g45890 [Chloropicon primus]|nr:hypothetical protein HOP50_06g45890 [Chloropicon primus]